MRLEGWRSPLPDAPHADTSTSVAVHGSPLPARASLDLDALARRCGKRGVFRTIEFLTAHIRNRRTRRAYHAAARRFLAWCTARSLRLEAVRSIHVASYVEGAGSDAGRAFRQAAPGGAQALVDWLVTGHVLEANPAHAVRGPRYSQATGKTPVLEKAEAKALLDAIDASTLSSFSRDPDWMGSGFPDRSRRGQDDSWSSTSDLIG